MDVYHALTCSLSMDTQHNETSKKNVNDHQSRLSISQEGENPSVQTYGLIGNTHVQVLCCSGTACYSSGSLKIIDNFIRVIAEYGLGSRVDVVATGCFGFCAKGPIVRIMPDLNSPARNRILPSAAVNVFLCFCRSHS